ncbi:T9SS type A sorting domain-containing protein [Adhaeribacter arboris]|uniref:T9SS type A sorting domain-containing protein n=1 Tax=Adhaeribacter arboris TaxID=2072846 RepID=UPI000D129216|nr:T9SS type A sorting domain-containing protein [Adhaeribacter arboris]
MTSVKGEVRDVLGRKIQSVAFLQKEKGLYTYQMDLTNIATGLYVVQVKDGEQVLVAKYVKQN